jgi:hypothetical protein
MEALWIVIATALSGLLTLLITGWQNGRSKRAERSEKVADREAEWARQDKVADRLVAAQTAATQAAEKVARTAATTAKDQGQKLDQIHTLVNSNMTTAMENELASYQALLALLKKESPPDEETKGAIKATEERVEKLTVELDDRLRATEKAAAQLASGTVKKPVEDPAVAGRSS